MHGSSRVAGIAVAMLGMLVATGAVAEETERYRLEKTDNGYVRLDTTTGAMSICEERDNQLVCRMAADERSAFQDEIDRLSKSVDALEGRVTALEKAPLVPGLPTEEEFGKTLSYMEQFIRSFMGVVQDMNNDKAEPPTAQPQKT